MGCRPPRIFLLLSRSYGTLGAQSEEKGTALLTAGLYFSATRHGGFDDNLDDCFSKNSLLFVLCRLFRIILCFFIKALDKYHFILYNNTVKELGVVQEASGFCFYILVSAFAEQKANEEYG